jgi:hypothetical protein
MQAHGEIHVRVTTQKYTASTEWLMHYKKNWKKGTIFTFHTFNASKDRKLTASMVIQIKYYKINVLGQ